MPSHSFDALFRSLGKGDLAPVYYFFGVEDVLKDEAVRSILEQALEPGMRDLNLDQRSASQVDAEEVHALCNTLPMMAERRVVVFREVEAWKRKTKARAEFLRYLERPCPQTLVILVQGSSDESEDQDLVRETYAVRFDPLSAGRASKWVLRQAGLLGIALPADAADHLVRSVGPDLAALSSELAKLGSLPADLPLSVERVGELVGVRHGETSFDWRSAVLEDRTGPAATLIPEVLAQPGMSGVKLVSSLGTSLIGLGLTRSLYDRGLRGRELEDAVFKALLRNRPTGLLSYREEASRWSRVVAHWPASRIRSALKAALEADQALKSTTISDEAGVLKDLVLRIGLSKGEESGESERVDRSKVSRAMQTVTRVLVVLSAVSAFSALSALSAQTDPRLIEIIRLAQEGQGDSARAKVQRLLAVTPPGDTLYPQIVYTQAMVANDAADMRRQLQRVAVEHSSSSWADDALLRLVQLDYASSNLDGAARNVERIRLDYPDSPLLSQASYWAARTYFDQKRPELACRWIAQGLSEAAGNIELQNQLGYLNQRCAQFATADRPRPDTQPSPRVSADSPQVVGVAPPPDTAPLAPDQPDTTRRRPAPGPPPPAAQPPVASTPPAPPPRAAPPAADTMARPAPAGTRYRIQITAVRSVATAKSTAAKVQARGFDVVMIEEGGLYKVRVGSYATKAEAIAALPEVKAKLGGTPFVVTES